LHWLFLWEKGPFSAVTHSETGSGIGLEAVWDAGRGVAKNGEKLARLKSLSSSFIYFLLS